MLLKNNGTDLIATTSQSNMVHPVTAYDNNGDGLIDVCGSGEQEGVVCLINNGDGTFASDTSYRGECSTGKYGAVAMDKTNALIQLNEKGSCSQSLHELEFVVDQTHLTSLSPPVTAAVNDATFEDLDNDGKKELVVLTDEELNVYTLTESVAYLYDSTLTGINVDPDSHVTHIIGTYNSIAEAKTACDGDTECIGYQHRGRRHRLTLPTIRWKRLRRCGRLQNKVFQ